MKIEDNPYVEKLPFMFDINQLQQHLYDNVLTLGDPIIQGGAYGGAFGGWSVLANNATWTGGWTQGHKAMKQGGFDYKIAKELGVVHDFSHDKPTEACTGIFKEVVDQLEAHGYYPRRVRTTVLQPGGQSSRHRDAPNDAYACRIHIPLVTYEGCVHTVWDDDNREYPIHMPADGGVYILHVNNQHQIVNPTDKPRYHIIMNAWDTKGIAQDESFHFPHIEVLKERVEVFNERVRTARGIVRLGAQDLSRVLKLDALHNKHMNVDKAGRFDSSFWQRFLTNDSDRHILLGYEEDGELHGTIGMFLWPSFPYWTVSGFMLRPGRRAYSYTTNPALTALWNGSLDVAESMDRYKFYMLKSNKWRTPRRVKDWYTHVGDPRGYTLGIETIIEPNTMPRWKGYWFLMAEQTWPEQLHIMCGTKLHYNID